MRFLFNYCRKLIALFILLLCFYVGVKIFNRDANSSSSVKYVEIPTVLWWTKILPDYHRTKQCGLYKCTFTVDREMLDDDKTRAVTFYGSEINRTDFPLPRFPHHIWALFHEESPKNVPYIQYESLLQHFNITATFSRYSSYPLTTQYLDSLTRLTSKKYLVPIGEKTKLRTKEKLAPVAFVQSICDTMSGRDEYVKELMKYIDVDSYGKCLNNKKIPEALSTDYLRVIDSEQFYKFLARYKFIISYENGICNDYITEKLWRPLIIGSIPVYFGSPTVQDWLPTKKSAILISDFDSPKKLANYLKDLDQNDYEYNTYLDHKYSQIDPITNELLKNSLLNRDYTKDSLFENFECFVCEKIHSGKNFHSFANQKHYDCGEKLDFPKMDTNMVNNDWHSTIKYGKCQANVLNYFLTRNKNYTTKEFDDMLAENIRNGVCKLL